MKACRILFIFILSVGMLLISGCWDYQEVENMYIVGGIAVDKGMQGHKYHLTFEVLDLSGGQQNSGMKGKLLESEGDSIADAVGAMTKSSDNALYLSDCKVVIFSKDLAAEGMTPILDWLNRDPKPRFTVQLFVSQEKTAGEILKGTGGGEEVVSFNISNIIDQSSSQWGKSAPVQLNEVDSILWGQGKELTLPCLHINTQQNQEQIELDGTAVFKGDKYVGLLDEKQSQFFLFASNDVQGGVLLTGEKPDDTDISLQIQKSSTEAVPHVLGDTIRVDLKTKMKAVFDEENTQKNYLKELGVGAVEKFAEATLEKKIKDTVHDEQLKFGSDIFGFGKEIYENDPAAWKKLGPDWDRHYRNVGCEVTAQVQITNSGFAFPKGNG